MFEVLLFLLGFLCGGFGFMIYGLWLIKRSKAAAKKRLIEETRKVENKKESVKQKMARAAQIGEQQMMLQQGASMPSKNALHSKHKNGIIQEIRKLEEEKLALLRSILNDDKVDPVVTGVDEAGVRHEMKLSDFLARREGITPPTEQKPQGKVKAIGKFVIHKGGKNDGGVIN